MRAGLHRPVHGPGLGCETCARDAAGDGARRHYYRYHGRGGRGRHYGSRGRHYGSRGRRDYHHGDHFARSLAVRTRRHRGTESHTPRRRGAAPVHSLRTQGTARTILLHALWVQVTHSLARVRTLHSFINTLLADEFGLLVVTVYANAGHPEATVTGVHVPDSVGRRLLCTY